MGDMRIDVVSSRVNLPFGSIDLSTAVDYMYRYMYTLFSLRRHALLQFNFALASRDLQAMSFWAGWLS